MTFDDLKHIIREHGVWCNGYFDIRGCKVLEHIKDIDGFVSLLGNFNRPSDGYSGSFMDYYPEPIETILSLNVWFCISDCGNPFWIGIHGGAAWQYSYEC